MSGKKAAVCRADFLKKDSKRQADIELIVESPLLIRVENRPVFLTMRTPGSEIEHAAGYCLGEGIVEKYDECLSVTCNKDTDPNIVDVSIVPERREQAVVCIEKRNLNHTAQGVSSRTMVKDLVRDVRKNHSSFKVGFDDILRCVTLLSKNQKYHKITRGSHAALLFDYRLETIAFAEDVGRHNALDKVLGKAFMDNTLSDGRILVMSSRMSYELIHKAARAGLPILVSYSRPTALAAEIGQLLGMTLVFPAGDAELISVSGENRIIKKD
ncbi:MAG: formate dehydrogenase accessory sulfurtransferase FdhD [Desulfobacteraceae bacterium]